MDASARRRSTPRAARRSAACAAAACEEVESESVLHAAALSADDIARDRRRPGATGPPRCRAGRRRAGRALSALASSGEPIAAAPLRSACSSPCPAASIRRLPLCWSATRGADVVAVTLKLWADERTDGTQACCSPEAVRGARSLCHSLGIPHLTLDLEDAFRREVVGAFVGGYRAGETPNPCVICNGDLRIDAMVSLADRSGRFASRDGPLRAPGRRRLRAALSELRPIRRRIRPTCSRACARRRSRGFASPSARLTKPEVRARAGRRGPRGRVKAREPGPLLPRGRGQALVPRAPRRARRPARRRSWTRPAMSSASTRVITTSRSASAAGSAWRPVSPSTSPGRTSKAKSRGRRGEGGPGADDRSGCEARASTATRNARRSVRLRYHAHAIPCRVSAAGPGEHAELELELAEPAYGVAPGQTACLYDGDLVIGRATIASAA